MYIHFFWIKVLLFSHLLLGPNRSAITQVLKDAGVKIIMAPQLTNVAKLSNEWGSPLTLFQICEPNYLGIL